MKNKFKIAFAYIIAALALMSCASTQSIANTEANLQDGGPHISFQVFYQSLSPYGRWISYPQYGQVWIPNAGRGFQPYSTNGQWVYSTYGWTWVSSYPWGWAPFHYGRWLYDDYYGWVWVPGNQWAPAWVAWRNSSDYYGWAPLGPGINISINIGIPAARWIFVPRHYFGSHGAYRYYVPRERNTTIIHNTTIIRNVNVYQNNRYFSGPRRQEVESSTHRTVHAIRIANANSPGVTRVNNRQLNIYRPTITRTVENERTISSSESSRPQRVTSEQHQQSTPPRGQVETNRPVRTADPSERTIRHNNSRPVNTPNNDRRPVPVRNMEQRRTQRTIYRPTPRTTRSKSERVETRATNKQYRTIQRAKPVQRNDRGEEYSSTHAHRR